MIRKDEIRNVLNRVISKSFPIFKDKKIYFYHFTFFDYAGGASWFLPFWRTLFINNKTIYSKRELEALIAHELCHLEIFQKKGWIKTILFGIPYWLSDKYRKNMEEKTEKLTIRKGYARGAYEIANKSRVKNRAKYYMSAEEIKKYAKEIGKW